MSTDRPPAGWYPDPFAPEKKRYWDGTAWLDSTPAPASRRGKRVIWYVLAAVILFVGAGALAIEMGFGGLEHHETDLTQGSGSIPTGTYAEFTTSYTPDGYRMTIQAPGYYAMAGVNADFGHTNLSAEVEAILPDAPQAKFGPGCWMNENVGFAFLVSSNGMGELVQTSWIGQAPTRMAVVSGLSTPSGLPLRLTIKCVTGAGPGTELAGYVGTTKVIEASFAKVVPEFRATGFAGFSGTAVPVSWVVTTLWRLGPDEAPQ